MGAVLVLLVELLFVLAAAELTGEELSGHLKPLGSHMPPEQVRRVSYLPTPMEFHQGFVLPKTPVIMEGALKNSAVWKLWQDDDYLREHFGDEIVDIEQGKKENRSDHRFSLTVRDFLDRYKEEDIYMVSDLTPSMFQEWEVPRPLACGGFTDNFSFTYMWFSSGGTKSVLHTDSYENFHCLVSGRKEFVLIEPHYSTVIGPEHAQKGFYDVDVEKVDMRVYPELSRIPWVQAIVHEGDCLYLPYQWIHTVDSYHRNMGVNIWWIDFEFDGSTCPPELPEYFPLGTVDLAPEMSMMEALGRVAKPDGSVLATDLYTLIRDHEGEVPIVEQHHIEQLLEVLEPGCQGHLSNYKSLPKARIKAAYEYMMTIGPPPPGDFPPEGDENYYPHEEFGGTGHDDMDGRSDHMTEGGGDFHDEL